MNMISKMKCHEKITSLSSLKNELKLADKSFAVDLITKHAVYGLSEEQIKWVDILIERAKKGYVSVEQPKIDVGDFSGVIKLFAAAKQHLSYPKIVLSCEGKSIILSVAGKASKNPGWINLTGEGQYPNRPYYGKVSPEGNWIPAKMDEPMQAALRDLLVEFSLDPAKIAKEHGALTGLCCFCNAKLTDKRSTAAGFGPICSKHWGLEDQWKNAVKIAEEKEKLNLFEKFSKDLGPEQQYLDPKYAASILEEENDLAKAADTVLGLYSAGMLESTKIIVEKSKEEKLPHYENKKGQKFYFPQNSKDAKITFLPIEEYHNFNFSPLKCEVCGNSGMDVSIFENAHVCFACKAELVGA